MNNQLWPRTFNYDLIGDEGKNYETAIKMMKEALTERLKELDTLFNAF